MEMHDILKKISELSTLTESKETTHKGGTKSSDAGVTKHKGKYGTEYQGDGEEEEEDGDKKAKKAKAADAPKRGRGRPKKGADSSTGEVAKYQNAASLQSFMVGNLPKDKKGKPALPGKASKKHSLKEWFDEIDRNHLAETGMVAGGTGQPIMTQVDGKPVSMMVDPLKVPVKDKEAAKLAAQTLAQVSKNAPGSVVGLAPSAAGEKSSTTQTTAQTAMEEGEGDTGGKKWIKGAIKKPGAFTKKAKAAGKSTGEFASHVLSHKKDFPAKTEKQAVLAKTLSKLGKKSKSVKEGDVPSLDATAGPLTNTPHMDKPEKKTKAKKSGWRNSLREAAKPDFPDVDDDGNRKESIKSAAASAKAAKAAKKPVKEGSDSCRAAYHEGKCHAFENGHYRCRYDEGMDERNHYHRGFMEGLEECYGGGGMMEEGQYMFRNKSDDNLTPIEPFKRPSAGTSKAAYRTSGVPGSQIQTGPMTLGQKAKSIVKGVTGFATGRQEPTYESELDEGGSPLGFDEHDPLTELPPDYKGPTSPHAPEDVVHHEGPPPGFRNPKEAGDLMDYTPKGRTTESELDEDQFMAELDALDEEMEDMDEGWDASLDEMNKTQWMKHKAKSTPGDTFKAFGQTMKDKDVLEGHNDFDVTMESWNKQLQTLLNEDATPIAEGVTVSTSSGQEHSPDSVSISATDADAHRLLQLLSNAGIGLGHTMAGTSSTDATDDYSSETGSNQSFSRNVDDVDCEVIVPYEHDEISGALSDGGDELKMLRKRLLAMEGVSGDLMESDMEHGKQMMSVQHEEDEPLDTPESVEPCDFAEVQQALEKGGKASTKAKSDKEKIDESSFLVMPPGMGFSKPGESKEKMEDGPDEMPVEDLDGVLDSLHKKDAKTHDEYSHAFSKLKSLIQSQLDSENKSSSTKSESKPTQENYEKESEHDEELKEGSDRCDECGAMYEGSHEDHVCEKTAEKLDEWANTPGHTHPSDEWGNETVTTEEEYMINTISGGLNKQKVQRPGGYRQNDNPLAMSMNQGAPSDSLNDWLKLSGVR